MDCKLEGALARYWQLDYLQCDEQVHCREWRKRGRLGEDVGGSAPRYLGLSSQLFLLFGRNGAPNLLLALQQSL